MLFLELSYSCYTFFRAREESFSWQYSRRGILSKGARVLRWFLQCNPSSRCLLALNMYNYSLFPWLLCSIWPYNCIDYNLLYCCAYSLQLSSQCRQIILILNERRYHLLLYIFLSRIPYLLYSIYMCVCSTSYSWIQKNISRQFEASSVECRRQITLRLVWRAFKITLEVEKYQFQAITRHLYA